MQARCARLPRPWSRPRRSRGQCLRCAPGGRRSCRCRPLGRRAPAAAAQQRLRTLSAAAAATRTAARSRMRRRPLRAPEGSDPPLAACNKVAPCSQSHTQVVGEACRRLRPRSPGALPTSWSWTSGLPRWPLCGQACCSGAGLPRHARQCSAMHQEQRIGSQPDRNPAGRPRASSSARCPTATACCCPRRPSARRIRRRPCCQARTWLRSALRACGAACCCPSTSWPCGRAGARRPGQARVLRRARGDWCMTGTRAGCCVQAACEPGPVPAQARSRAQMRRRPGLASLLPSTTARPPSM